MTRTMSACCLTRSANEPASAIGICSGELTRVDDDREAVLLRGALEVHAKFLHDAKRCAIFGHRDGDHTREMRVFDRVLQCDAGCFRSKAAAPLILREAPADFHFGGAVELERLQTAEADEACLRLEQQLPKAKAARAKVILLARDELANLSVGARAAAANIPHHVGISENRAGGFEIGGRPFAEPEAIGFEMVRHWGDFSRRAAGKENAGQKGTGLKPDPKKHSHGGHGKQVSVTGGQQTTMMRAL